MMPQLDLTTASGLTPVDDGDNYAALHRRIEELEDTIRCLRGSSGARASAATVGTELTPREVDVLTLIVAGLGNKQIAQRLGVRLNTVRNHVQNVLNKLDAHTKLEAVATAVRDGVIAYPAGHFTLAPT